MPEQPLARPPERQTDDALVAAHQAGVAVAFEELCRRYRPRLVMWLAARTGDHHTAEDLAQEALLRAHQAFGAFDASRPLWPWLKAIARNLAIDHVRSPQRRQLPTADDALNVGAEAGAMADSADVVAERDLLAGAMAALDPRQRAIVGLRYLHDWTVTDVARVLGVTPNTAAQRLVRARGRLREEYRRLSGEQLRGLVWPLLWPYHALRGRLTRWREGGSALSPGPVFASVEALAATAAVTVIAVGQWLGPGPAIADPPAAASRPSPDRVAPLEAPALVEPLSKPVVVDAPPAAPAPPSGPAAPDEAVRVTATPLPEAGVDARGDVESDGERTLVVVDESSALPVMNDDYHGRAEVEMSCKGPLRRAACAIAEQAIDE